MKIKIDPEALQDIQESINWYNEQQKGLGHKFYVEVKACFKRLKTNPFFQIRYDEVRCIPLRKYPYMVHYTLNEKNKTIIVRALFNTSRNPKTWKYRK